MDMTPAMVEACTARDISAIFRLLIEGGMTQHQIALLVHMSQSEVWNILHDQRQVQGYDVLVRIADALGVPRGMMGLAYEEPREQPEVDEDVERRKLLALAGAIMFGVPVFGEPEPLAVRRVLLDPPRRVGMSDVRMYEQTMVGVTGSTTAGRRFGDQGTAGSNC